MLSDAFFKHIDESMPTSQYTVRDSAVAQQNLKEIKRKRGFDINARNNAEKTLLDIAKSRRLTNMSLYLECLANQII